MANTVSDSVLHLSQRCAHIQSCISSALHGQLMAKLLGRLQVVLPIAVAGLLLNNGSESWRSVVPARLSSRDKLPFFPTILVHSQLRRSPQVVKVSNRRSWRDRIESKRFIITAICHIFGVSRC